MSADEPEPALAPEESPTTALVVAPEQPTSTTIELEKRRIVLAQWEQRRDLHQTTTKAYRDLADKCAVLRQAYERDVAAYRGRQLMQPALREAAAKKRTATLEKKRAATIDRVVASVEGVAPVKDKAQLKAAVAAALAPPQEPPKKKKQKKAAVEEEDSE